MYCPKCGNQNPDDAQSCNSCGVILKPPPKPITCRTSSLAIAALILGILSIFTFMFTAIPSIILGIISFIIIEKSGGRITGKGFALAGILIPVLTIALTFLALLPIRRIAYQMHCGTNLAQIGMAMMLYANENDNELPRAGGGTTTWSNRIPNWKAADQFSAFGMAPDGSGGKATITSSLYLLPKYSEVDTKTFVCKADKGVRYFYPSTRGTNTDDFWDLGPNPREHCSYAYHLPYDDYALTATGDPGLAILADRNPWIAGPGTQAKDFSLFNPNGDRQAVKAGNSPSHQSESQNVLFLDIHVDQERSPDCGVDGDNIYTFQDGHFIRTGKPPVPGESRPSNNTDSFLVNDGP